MTPRTAGERGILRTCQVLLWAAVLLAVANVVGEWTGVVPPWLLLLPAALAVLGLLVVATWLVARLGCAGGGRWRR